MFKAVDYKQFEAACAEQGVVLDQGLTAGVASACAKVASHNSLADPHQMLRAIQVAASWLQRRPRRGFATGEALDLAVFGDDVLAVGLGKLANCATAPGGVEALKLPVSQQRLMGTCAKSEPGFASAVRSLTRDPERAVAQLVVKDGQVVAIRKGRRFGACSGLTLVPIEGEVYLPAGTLVRLDVQGDRIDKDGYPRVSAASERVVSVDEVTGIAYRRPSSFALPQEQRLAHFGPEELAVAGLQIDTIATMAQNALERL